MNRSHDRGHTRGASGLKALLLGGLLVLPAVSGRAQEAPAGALAELSLEELLGVEVTLATRRVQRLFDVASAVYVITAEDIRRSGATSIPEALRMVPGLHVARSGSSKWAISARGFTDEFANKLLVLIDGRSVYTPLFAGVYWDTQDVLLEDIERIEVVRGPGAALWGANAVNGIVNIVTRRARDTQGTLVTAGAGSADRAVVGVRYGGSLGSSGHYRAWAKHFDRASFADPAGEDAADQWDVQRAGARLEWQGARDDVGLDGEVYRGDIGSTTTQSSRQAPYTLTSVSRFAIRGAHVRGRWERRLTDDSRAELRAWYDHTERGDALETRRTLDVELLHSLRFGRHRPLWGFGYRRMGDAIGASPVTAFVPPRRTAELFSGFAQDEVALAGGDASLIVGAKLEHNDFTGLELQPSARLAWFPTGSQVVWGAVSRAVRTPSRSDHDLRYAASVFPAGGVLNEVTIVGDPGAVSEEVVSWELGYRAQPAATVSLDLAAFVNDYDRLRSLEPEAPLPVGFDEMPVVALPLRIGNGLFGRTWGAELAANWAAAPGWRLAAAYTHLHVDTRARPESRHPTPDSLEGDSPRHQLNLRSFLDLPGGFELDTTLYHCSSLPTRGVPAWTRLDLMLGWRPSAALELRIGVQDLLEDGQLQFDRNVGGRLATAVPRVLFGRVAWHF